MRKTILLVTLLLPGLVAIPAKAATGQIAVGAWGKGRTGLFVVQADGSGSRRISSLYHMTYDPAWSPDGSLIAFNSTASDGTPGTYSIRPDGTDRHRLSVAPCYDEYDPDWSPNGRRIVFRHDTCERAHVVIMNRFGHDKHRLVPGVAFAPDWSPIEPVIVYVGRVHQQDQIFRVRPDGSHQQRLTFGAGADLRFIDGNSDPRISPQGDLVAYSGSTGPLKSEHSRICLVTIEGLHDRCLTDGTTVDTNPTISPDGRTVAFVRKQDGSTDIYLIDRDGTNLRRLTTTRRSDYSPEWSPDGEDIAFLSARSGNVELYAMRSDGSNVQRLTRSPEAREINPEWAPL